MRAAALGLSLAAALFLAAACQAEAPDTEDALHVDLQLRDASGASIRRLRRGASLACVLTLHNPSDEPRRLLFSSAKTHDVAVSTAEGREVWRLSDGLAYIQMLTEIEVPPRGSHELRGRWDVPEDLEPGEYTVRATVTVQSAPLEAPPVVFTIE
jgi:hypothetical protein